jgi:hypothetical protein
MRAIVLSHLPEEFSLADPTQQERAVRELNGKTLGSSTVRARALPTGEAYAVFLLSPPDAGK